MPLHIADYLADTMHLTARQHGAYLLLLMSYWRSREPLPDDDYHLANTCRLSLDDWQLERRVLVRFFEVIDGVWHHGRVEKELAKSMEFLEKQRTNGRLGGRPRKTQAESQKNPMVMSGLTQTEPNQEPKANPNESPSQSPSQSPSPSTPPAQAPVVAASRRKPSTKLPDDWAPNEKHAELAAKQGVNLGDQLRKFLDHCEANDRRYASWDAGFRTWLNNAKRYGGGSKETFYERRAREAEEWASGSQSNIKGDFIDGEASHV